MKDKSVILGIVIIIIVIFATTGCIFYHVEKPEDFKKTFGDAGYTIVDTNNGKYESKVYLEATKEDIPFVISYYEFDTEVEAQKAYKKYTLDIVSYITSDSSNTENTGAVFSKTVAVSQNEYIVISRVKNTLIFIPGLKEYKNDIDTILKSIKY